MVELFYVYASSYFFIPFLILFFSCIALVFVNLYLFVKYEKTIFTIHYVDNRSITQLKLFWFMMLFPICLGLAVASSIYFNGEYYFKPDHMGFNNLYDDFKVSFWVSGLSIPLVAMVASMHRSEQDARQIEVSKKQIEIQRIQNNFVNHFKHIEEHGKAIDSFINKKNVEISDELAAHREVDACDLLQMDSRVIHKAVYPGTLSGSYEVHPNIISLDYDVFKYIFEFIAHSSSYKEFPRLFDDIYNLLEMRLGFYLNSGRYAVVHYLPFVLNESAAFSGMSDPPFHARFYENAIRFLDGVACISKYFNGASNEDEIISYFSNVDRAKNYFKTHLPHAFVDKNIDQLYYVAVASIKYNEEESYKSGLVGKVVFAGDYGFVNKELSEFSRAAFDYLSAESNVFMPQLSSNFISE